MKRLKDCEGQSVEALLDQLMRDAEDGAVKLYVTSRALQFRKAHAEPDVQGLLRLDALHRHAPESHCRFRARASALNPLSRLPVDSLWDSSRARAPPIGPAWGDTVLSLRKEPAHQQYRDIFTQQVIEVEKQKGKRVLPLAKVFSHLPVSLLLAIE